MQIFDFKMLLCREFSKPKFQSMVHVNHRCTLPEVASRTYDELIPMNQIDLFCILAMSLKNF